jgi:tetratricopeptide (TPR) repeat protein
MINEFSVFVGREKELKLINRLVKEESTSQLLFVIGPGGIGKTKLLQQVTQMYANDSSVIVSPIIDFDETSHRLEFGIFNLIAQTNRGAFSQYLDQYEDYTRILRSNVGQSRIAEEELKTKSAFVSCYNENIKNKRGILLFDTVEILSQSGIWIGLVQSLSRLNNSVVIFAGREYGQAKGAVKQYFGSSNTHFVTLKPFTKRDTLEYFDRLASRLDPNIREKLFVLTNGHPILLALAVLWLGRDKPFPEIYDKPVEELEGLDSNTRERLTQKFREALVSQLLEPRRATDNVIIQMACVHRRFDQEILAFMLGLSCEKSQELIQELRVFPFVKPKPYGITLHDEMRALVNAYIWPKIDPMGLERRKLAEKAVQYYDIRIREFEQAGNDLVWLYRVEQLYYQLQYDLFAGYERFVQYFEAASLRYQRGIRNLLLDEIQRVQHQYGPGLQYEIEIREARALLEEGRLTEADDKLRRMIQLYREKQQQVEILVLMGNVEIRLGRTIEVIKHGEEALQIAQQANLESWIGKTELALGWFHRIRGDWSKAFKYYEDSLEHTVGSGDRMTLGLIFNNLAYITEFSGDHISALGYSEQAIKFFEALNAPRELAMCYSTLGEIYVYDGNYQSGLDYYQKALETFEKQYDVEFLGLVYSQIGRTLIALGRSGEAQDYGERGVKLCRAYSLQNLPVALHRLGRIYEEIGRFDRAAATYLEGQKVSEQLADSRYVMEHTVYLADLYYRMWREAEDPAEKEKYLSLIWQTISVFDQEASKRIYVYPQDYLSGRIKVLQGNIKYELQQYDEAIEIYKVAYYHIIIGSSDTYTANELSKFSDRISQLPGQIALKWIQILESFWEEKGILSSKPQAANFCKKHRISALLQP